MKFKKLAGLMLVASAALALGACGNSKDSDKGSADKSDIVTDVTEDTTITFWHAMNGAQEEALTKLTDDFMAANPKIKVELQNQGSYGDMQAKITSTMQSPKDLPTITQAYPGWLWDASQGDLLVDLGEYMDNDKIGWGDQAPIKEDLLAGAQIEGTQYGMPFNKSTEALFYNQDILTEYGVEVPTNLDELKEASKTIYEKSGGKVTGVGFDSLNNYYVIGLKNQDEDFTKDLDIADDASKEVINYYAEGVKDGYFRIAGSDGYLSGPFANGQVAMFVGSTAGESYVAKDATFEYGVAPRPEKINIQQGTDLYMFTSADANQRTAAYLLMKYLTSEDAQLYWAQNTGYMPVLDKVIESDAYQKSENTKIPAILAENTEHLTSIPVKQNADAAYNEMKAIMENILSNPTQDVDKMIEDGKASLDSAWNQ